MDLTKNPDKMSEQELRNEVKERRAREEYGLIAIQKLVDEQAEDEGLWFHAETAPEAYLQQELRRLHRVIEGETENESTG